MKSITPSDEARLRRLHAPLIGLSLAAGVVLLLILAALTGSLGPLTHLGMGMP